MHLKGGGTDNILYRVTMGLCVGGECGPPPPELLGEEEGLSWSELAEFGERASGWAGA